MRFFQFFFFFFFFFLVLGFSFSFALHSLLGIYLVRRKGRGTEDGRRKKRGQNILESQRRVSKMDKDWECFLWGKSGKWESVPLLNRTLNLHFIHGREVQAIYIPSSVYIYVYISSIIRVGDRFCIVQGWLNLPRWVGFLSISIP